MDVCWLYACQDNSQIQLVRGVSYLLLLFAYHFSADHRFLQALHSILWTLMMFVIREIPMQPFALYRNFVLEERHGFNKMTIAT